MISVGSRDGRKGLGLGLGLGFGGGEEMEETELEEGEACYYRDGDKTSIDPDLHLSYIDERVQDVLGHFQKDFEGGVSAENLGAKFGGYGSFLPTHQRSPSILSHPRTPQKVQNYSTPRSPNNLPSEAARQNATVPSSATLSMRLGPASTSAVLHPVSRAPSLDNSSKRDLCLPSAQGTGEFTPKHEPVNKLVNPTDQKTLKVRIKVGPDSLSNQKNAAIYNGLGLDISPSSSLEDSPTESGGLSPEFLDEPDESPMSIIRLMTSFLLPVSPLPDTLLRLMVEGKLLNDTRSGLACKGSQESFAMLLDESPSVRADGKVFGEKKPKSVEKNGRSKEVKNGKDRGVWYKTSVVLRKEIDIEAPAGRELVYNALKLPLLSNSKCIIDDTAKGTGRASDKSREANKFVVKDSSDFTKEEDLESMTCHDVNRVEMRNSKTSSADKVWEDRKASSHKDVQFDQRKDGRSEGDKIHDPFNAEFDGSKGRKDFNGGPIDPPKEKVGQRATSHEQYGLKMPHRKEQPSSGSKKKSKGSQSNGTLATAFPNESLRVDSSAPSKGKKKSIGDYPSKSKLDDNRLHKESVKTRESHRDLFGGTKMEEAESRIDSLETPVKDRPKDSKLVIVEKETHTFADKSMERLSGKKVDNPFTSQAYPKATSVVAPLTRNGPVSDPVPATVDPIVIEEHWVCCDRCQKWRLLPYGTNLVHLPNDWLCSMLYWLPGMNRCNISEEETTKALNALYQFPVPESQNNLQSNLDGAASGVTLADVRHLDQTHQDHGLHSVPSRGKKKHGSKEASNVASHMGPVHSLNSTKQNQQVSVKSRTINDVNQSPSESNLANKAGSQHLRKSSDIAVEKHRHKQKEKNKLLSGGGDPKHLKMNSKRKADQDGFRASKKIKTGLYNTEEIWNSDRDGVMGKLGPSLSNGLPAKATGKDVQKYSEYPSCKDSKCEAKDSLPASVKKPKNQVQDSLDGVALDTAKCDKMDIATKKRKVKEWQESQLYPPETLPSTEHHLQDNRVSVKEGISESELRKEKKARVSKSEGKESSTSKGGGRTDKKTRMLTSGTRDPIPDGMEEEGSGGIEKDQQLGQYRAVSTASQRTFDGIDSSKRDLGQGQPSTAATSSSSKVSGSRKNKANFQEVKGSPVESVSSSPLRISNPDKDTSAKRNPMGKDDAMNVGYSVMGSPRRCSDGEGDGGSDRSGTVRKGKAASVINHGSLESSVLDYQHRDANHTLGDKAKAHTEPFSSDFENTHLVNCGTRTLDQHNQCPGELRGKEHGHDERVNNNHYHSIGSLACKSGKGSSSRSKDKRRSSKYDYDKGNVKVSDSFSEQEELYPTKNSRYEAEIESHDHSPHHEELRSGKYSSQEKCGVKSNKNEKNCSGKKDSAGKWSSESRRGNQSKLGGHEGADIKLVAACSKPEISIPQQNLLQDREGERSSNQFLSDRTDRLEIASGREKIQLFPHSGDKQKTQTRCPRPIPGTHKGSGSDVLPVDASAGGGDALHVPKQPRKPDNQKGPHHSSLRHSTPNGVVVRDLDAPSPVRKDSSSQAVANALKEAKDLKHTADRLKNSGLDLESTTLYFQAALKFLYGASLLEACNTESAKHEEIYRTTAKFCGFVAREYEKCKEMAAAALAYKCMEVAYMRVIYSKHSGASKDQNELQAALQMVLPGESPSSSASDVDNLNNPGTLDKVALDKGVSSPQIGGNHVIVARNLPNFVRLLNFAQEVNFAMEASRKSQNALAAANVGLEEARYAEGISSVRRVIDFNFHDVEGLLHLIRLAMEAISC